MSNIVPSEILFSGQGGELEFSLPSLPYSKDPPQKWRARVLWFSYTDSILFVRCLVVQSWQPKRFTSTYDTSFGYGWSPRKQAILRNLTFSIKGKTLQKGEVIVEKKSHKVITCMSDLGEKITYWFPEDNILNIADVMEIIYPSFKGNT